MITGKKNIKLLLIIALLTVTGCESISNKKIFISPDGNDQWNGSKNKPFRTLMRAKEAVRNELEFKNTATIEVILKDGIYYLDKTLVFTSEDSPSGNGSVVWKALNEKKAILTGAIELKDWIKNTENISDIPISLKDRIFSSDLPVVQGKTIHPKVLYSESNILKRARGKGFIPDIEPSRELKSEMGIKVGHNDTIFFPEGSIRNWSNLDDAELLIRPNFGWVMNILPLAEVNELKHFARTAIFATYPMRPLMWQEAFSYGKESCWIENVFEALKETGDWVLDSKRGKIYLVTEGEPPDYPVFAPVLEEFIRLEGNDQEGILVRNLVFKDLVFQYANRDTWEKEDIGLQHDWELYNKSNAVFRMVGVENCMIDGCRFTKCGNTAVRLDLYCQNNRIINNEISNMGGTGILLCGYGPGYQNVNKKNEIINNHIHHCGLQYWMSTSIFVWQSGENHIANNLIHDMPYNGMVLSGIRPPFILINNSKRELFRTVNRKTTAEAVEKIMKMAGNDIFKIPNYKAMDILDEFIYTDNNQIENNEIHDVMQVMADGDAIYISATGRGNIIKGNYIHDIITYGSIGHMIRNDGQQYWTEMKENIILNSSGGIVLQDGIKAVNNYIINVVFPPDAFPMPRREYCPFQIGSEDTICHYKLVKNVVYFEKTPVQVLYNYPFPLEGCTWKNLEMSDSNLVWSVSDPESAEQKILESREKHGLDENSLAADPGFKDPSNGDFTIGKESPLYQLGIKSLNIRDAGLLQERIK